MSKYGLYGIIVEQGVERLAGYAKTFREHPLDTIVRYYKKETLLPGSDTYEAIKRRLERKRDLNMSPRRDDKKKKQKKEKGDKSPDTKNDPRRMNIFPSTSCCVDLGCIDLRKHAKNGYKGDKVNLELCENDEYFEEYRQNTITSDKDRKVFHTLLDESISPSGSYNVSFVKPNICKFNSCEQLQKFFDEMSLVEPVYDTTTAVNRVTNKGDGDAVMVIKWQQLMIRVKNVSLNVSPAGGGTNNGFSETPVFCNLYVLQAKKDIYRYDGAATTNNDMQQWINNGWRSKYRGDETLGTSSSHPVGVEWKDNSFISEYFKCVSYRKFCLASGQEGHLQIKLGVPQVLSTKYKFNGVIYDTTVAPALLWTQVIQKKGSFLIIWDQHGGLHPFGEAVAPEDTKVLVHCTRKYEMCRFNPQDSDVQRNNTTNIPTPQNYTNDDLDIVVNY